MRETVRVCTPRYMQIGRGSLAKAGEFIGQFGNMQAPLIVTDRTMVELGVVDRFQSTLAANGIHTDVFDQATPDPTDTIVNAAITKLKSGGHDSVIAIGGGSPIDTGKAVAVMSQHGRDLLAYRPPVECNTPGLPMIAVPTTAGTGSEVSHHTVLIHESTSEKISCRGEAFVPTAAIIDYDLTLSKPKRLIADNALDTLSHGIEAYVSPKRSLFSDRMALDCMRLVGKYLARSFIDPEDHEAREGLMLAATFGGLAFSNASVGLIHGMSRPLGSFFHVPHGMGNAMLLPIVIRFAQSAAPERYATCGRAAGLAETGSDDDFANKKLLSGLFRFNYHLNVPSIQGFGVNEKSFEDALEPMTDDALRSGAQLNTPRIATRQNIIGLYREAWKSSMRDDAIAETH